MISNTFPISCICALLFSPLLALISFVCRWFPTFNVCLPLPVSFSVHNFLISNCDLFFSTLRNSFSICFKAGMVMLSSLSLYLSVQVFVFFFQFLDQIWMWALLEKIFLIVGSSLSSFKYIVPLPSGLQIFCWEIGR